MISQNCRATLIISIGYTHCVRNPIKWRSPHIAQFSSETLYVWLLVCVIKQMTCLPKFWCRTYWKRFVLFHFDLSFTLFLIYLCFCFNLFSKWMLRFPVLKITSKRINPKIFSPSTRRLTLFCVLKVKSCLFIYKKNIKEGKWFI